MSSIDRLKKKFSYKNQDKIFLYLSKKFYLIKSFVIVLLNLDPRPEDKNVDKKKQNRSQIKLKLPNNTN